VPLELGGGGRKTALLAEVGGDDLLVGVRVHDVLQRSVEDERPVANDDDALAEALDVFHVMTRQDHRRLVALAVLEKEVADGALRGEIQADRGLIEEDDLGLVEERGDQLQLHALAEAESAHLHVQVLLHIEHLG